MQNIMGIENINKIPSYCRMWYEGHKSGKYNNKHTLGTWHPAV